VSRPERHWWPLTGRVSGTRGVPAPGGGTRTEPIDPLTGTTLALAGRVVTMDDAFTVKDDAIVYIDKGRILAVQDRAEPAPPAFSGVTPVETAGTLFPGLIELHNHLSYNVLPPWAPVPKRFTHRGQWPDRQPSFQPSLGAAARRGRAEEEVNHRAMEQALENSSWTADFVTRSLSIRRWRAKRPPSRLRIASGTPWRVSARAHSPPSSAISMPSASAKDRIMSSLLASSVGRPVNLGKGRRP
jgi:hypothetical protein